MASRWGDWFRQAEADLTHARHALEDGHHEWACFAAQQAVMLDRGRALDTLYVPTRYPNGLPAGAPVDASSLVSIAAADGVPLAER